MFQLVEKVVLHTVPFFKAVGFECQPAPPPIHHGQAKGAVGASRNNASGFMHAWLSGLDGLDAAALAAVFGGAGIAAGLVLTRWRGGKGGPGAAPDDGLDDDDDKALHPARRLSGDRAGSAAPGAAKQLGAATQWRLRPIRSQEVLAVRRRRTEGARLTLFV